MPLPDDLIDLRKSSPSIAIDDGLDDAPVVISGICYELGERVSICDLIGDGVSGEDADLLHDQGVVGVSILSQSLTEAIGPCIERTLKAAQLRPAEIDTVILATESFGGLFEEEASPAIGLFRHTRNRIFLFLHHLGIRRASVLCATYGACTNLLQALIMAETLAVKGQAHNILVILGEKFGPPAARLMPEAVSIAGDGAATFIVSRATRDQTCGFRLRYIGAAPYKQFDTSVDKAKLLLEMFRAMRNAAADCYDACHLQPEHFRWLLLGDYNTVTSLTHGKLLGFPSERVFIRNVGRHGHIPFDPLINLEKLSQEQGLIRGDQILLFLCGPVACGSIALEAL